MTCSLRAAFRCCHLTDERSPDRIDRPIKIFWYARPHAPAILADRPRARARSAIMAVAPAAMPIFRTCRPAPRADPRLAQWPNPEALDWPLQLSYAGPRLMR